MEKRRGAQLRILLAVAIFSLSTIWPLSLQAQRGRGRGRFPSPAANEAVDDDSGPVSFAAPDRNILQALNRAQKVLKEQRYGEALEELSQILRSNEDYFFQPDRKVPIYKSLKAEAQRLLGQMPAEGRKLYEVRSGA